MPVNVGALTVTGAVPVEESVIDWAAVSLTPTVPKAKLVESTLNVGTTAPSCNAKVSVVLAAFAVKVAV